jgi:hypothetical protein
MSRSLRPTALALKHVQSGDFEGAQRCLEADADSEKVSGYYADLTRDLYAKNKNLAAMLALGRAGIDYQLREARRIAADNAERAVELRTAAKTLAFNVAANCWPGWGDDGIVIEAGHIEQGLELAKLALREVQELGLGPRALGNAYWLVGALDLAAHRAEAAMASFDLSRASSLSADAPLDVLLVDGYRAIAQSLTTRGENADVEFAKVIDQLKAEGSKKAQFYSKQLQTAAVILRELYQRSAHDA